MNEIKRGFLTPQQFAEALGVTEQQVHGWIRKNALPAVRLGRLTFVERNESKNLAGGQR